MKAKTNMTMLCDFYELTMGNGYFQTGLTDRICYFDVFYRSVPDQGGFAIAAGLALPRKGPHQVFPGLAVGKGFGFLWHGTVPPQIVWVRFQYAPICSGYPS